MDFPFIRSASFQCFRLGGAGVLECAERFPVSQGAGEGAGLRACGRSSVGPFRRAAPGTWLRCVKGSKAGPRADPDGGRSVRRAAPRARDARSLLFRGGCAVFFASKRDLKLGLLHAFSDLVSLKCTYFPFKKKKKRKGRNLAGWI